MGDPKKQHKKYARPGKPWEKQRIEEESAISKEFGLRNKREIWKIDSSLRNFFRQAKKAITNKTPQGEKEKAQLLKKLSRLGLVKEGAQIEDVLNITPKDVLQRRLQSIVFNTGMARTMNQARQFIVHEHIMINGEMITSPGYTVKTGDKVSFAPNSRLAKEDHPERVKLEPKEQREKKKKKKAVKVVRRRGRGR